MNYLAEFKQTGDLDSRPKVEHVRQAWRDPCSIDQLPWAQAAQRRGHGEYVDNVFNLIKAMKHRSMTVNDVPLMIDLIQPGQ